MRCYILTYENKSGFDEARLIQTIKDYGTWAHINGNAWAFLSDKPASQLRDEFRAMVNESDSVFVIKTGVEAAWSNTHAESSWLRKYLLYG
ncbi:MAG: hypothetical protein WCV86_03745 [Patescibacteria group bacterium]|jgi:hypothetical protein